ncbi:MAG: N-acetylmuramic acid 6-phosphate etherase [Albidovulum sp.]
MKTTTEGLHSTSVGLDTLPAPEVLRRLLAAQLEALATVGTALAGLDAGAELMTSAINGGGRIAYAGAGSSALMANADGAELPGTFGIPAGRVSLNMAGGIPTDAHMPGDTEDDLEDGKRAGNAFGDGDVVIAVSASGRTPYVIGFAQAARSNGAKIIAIANNAAAKIFTHADVEICLPTPPEIVAGSTRMGAATAQKVALNMMSTLMGIRLGQIHDGMMVGLIADNDKLRARAANMVAEIAGVDATLASQGLKSAGGAVKPAVLISCGASPDDATQILAKANGNLRAALALLRTTEPACKS